ncbi:MAG: diguanylate cyclase, partial [candidate division Zixibacteria bacterium]|nr:diguanylate cyclase [Phycisphaerae bacterium]NIR66522.1 diguanylate cyclase [candidate division Zixibacteria bacterium]NIU16205.1 diguanylate cyclase [candidate division Zixibacteria bacterium]NIV15073.1 diguanylate cyclase [Fodinibius sp.]
MQITVSVGISEFNKDDTDENAIVRRADEALYQAKRAGRNCVVPFVKSDNAQSN